MNAGGHTSDMHLLLVSAGNTRDKLESQRRNNGTELGELDKRIRTHINTCPGATSAKLDLSSESPSRKEYYFLIEDCVFMQAEGLDD